MGTAVLLCGAKVCTLGDLTETDGANLPDHAKGETGRKETDSMELCSSGLA